MLQQILGFLQPAFGIVDQYVEDKDLAAKIKASMQTTIIASGDKLNQIRGSVILEEARGQSWLQRNWRPMTMLFFVGLVASYWLGYAPPYLQENPALVESLLELVKIGLGGYVVGRSAEKIASDYSHQRHESANDNASLRARIAELEAELATLRGA